MPKIRVAVPFFSTKFVRLNLLFIRYKQVQQLCRVRRELSAEIEDFSEVIEELKVQKIEENEKYANFVGEVEAENYAGSDVLRNTFGSGISTT